MILRGYFSSEILRMGTNIQFLFPEQEPRRVVYLLHGLHGDQGTWLDRTMLPVYAAEYDAVFVIPEAGRSFYTDQLYGRKYFSYINEELPQVCKKMFGLAPARENTAVMGCSMGGYGALKLCLTFPQQYGFCGAISPACLYFEDILSGLRKNAESYRKTGAEAEETLKDLYAIYGNNLEYIPDYDIVKLAKKFDDPKTAPKFYITCGTEDRLHEENIRFREDIKNIPFDLTYEEWSGKHDWYFFNEALRKTLKIWYS